MWRVALCLVCATLGVGADTENGDLELYFALRMFGIVPDVIPFSPVLRCPVVFPGNKVVSLGNMLYLSDVKSKPAIDYETESDKYYTLAYIDAGVTTRMTHGPKTYRLWTVVNVYGNKIETGDEVSPYVRPSPIEIPQNTTFPAFHRYIVLVFMQVRKLEPSEVLQFKRSIGDRSGFSVADFLFPYNMSIPLFGNFFLARYNDLFQEKDYVRNGLMLKPKKKSRDEIFHHVPSREIYSRHLPVQKLSSGYSKFRKINAENPGIVEVSRSGDSVTIESTYEESNPDDFSSENIYKDSKQTFEYWKQRH